MEDYPEEASPLKQNHFEDRFISTPADDARCKAKRNAAGYLMLFLFLVFNVLLPTADVASDIMTAIKTHFLHGHLYWGAFTIILVFVPTIVSLFLTLLKVLKKEKQLVSLADSVWLLPGFQTYQSLQLFSSLIKAGNNLKLETMIKLKSTEFIRLETYFEALPQLILQCYIFCRTDVHDFWQPLTMALSYASLASTSTLSFCLYDLSGKGPYISPGFRIRLFLLPVMAFSYLGPLFAFFVPILYQPGYILVLSLFFSMFYFKNPVLLMQNLSKKIASRNHGQKVVQVLILVAVLSIFFALEYVVAICDSIQIKTKPLTFCYTSESLSENNLKIVEDLNGTNFFPNVFKVFNDKDNNNYTVRLCEDGESANDMFHKFIFPTSFGFVFLSLVFVWIGNRLKYYQILYKWTHWMTYFKMTPIIHVDIFKELLSPEEPTLDPTSSETLDPTSPETLATTPLTVLWSTSFETLVPTTTTSISPKSSESSVPMSLAIPAPTSSRTLTTTSSTTTSSPTSSTTTSSPTSSVTLGTTSSAAVVPTSSITFESTSSSTISPTASSLAPIPLSTTVDTPRLHKLEYLLQSDKNAMNLQDLNTGETPMHFALNFGRWDELSLMIVEYGGDVSICNFDGKSVLQLLNEKKNPEAENLKKILYKLESRTDLEK